MKKAALILIPSVTACPGPATADSAITVNTTRPDFLIIDDSPLSTGEQEAWADIVSEVIAEGRIFNLRCPLVVTVSQGDIWCHECPELDIYASGNTEGESYQNFAMGFAASWDGLASEADENLTLDARELRDHFRSYVRDVEGVL